MDIQKCCKKNMILRTTLHTNNMFARTIHYFQCDKCGDIRKVME